MFGGASSFQGGGAVGVFEVGVGVGVYGDGGGGGVEDGGGGEEGVVLLLLLLLLEMAVASVVVVGGGGGGGVVIVVVVGFDDFPVVLFGANGEFEVFFGDGIPVLRGRGKVSVSYSG